MAHKVYSSPTLHQAQQSRSEAVHRLKPAPDPIRARQQESLKRWKAHKRRQTLKRVVRDVVVILILGAAVGAVMWGQA